MALDRLSAEDRLILWPDQRWPQDVGALGVLAGGPLLGPEGRIDLAAARDAVAARLHLVPRLRQVLHEPRRGLGGPLWVDAPSFDLTQHVQTSRIPAPGDERQLLLTVERLRRRRLDRTRPLWEMWFLTGLADGNIGLFIRLHHVVADGMAGIASLGAFLDPAPEVPAGPPQPWTPAPPPSALRLLVDHLRRRAGVLGRGMAELARPSSALRRGQAAWPALRELFASEPGPETSLDGVVGAGRNLALVRGTLDEIKRIAHGHDAKVNDVLLAAAAGGVHALLASRGESVVGLVVPVYVPVVSAVRSAAWSVVRRRRRVTYQVASTVPMPGTKPINSTSSNDSPSMLGCNSTSVAQPNHTSLMNKPPTKYAAAAMSHSHRVVFRPTTSWAMTPKPSAMATSNPSP